MYEQKDEFGNYIYPTDFDTCTQYTVYTMSALPLWLANLTNEILEKDKDELCIS